jgi:hypothetical protein
LDLLIRGCFHAGHVAKSLPGFFVLVLIFPSLPVAATEPQEAKGGMAFAMAKPPFQPKATEIGRDVRFIAYDDGTVLDTRTGLMWAAQDNGRNIEWADADTG